MNISQMRFNLTLTPVNVVGGCKVFTHLEFKDLDLSKCEYNWTSEELENYKSVQSLYLKQLEIKDPVLREFIRVSEGV